MPEQWIPRHRAVLLVAVLVLVAAVPITGLPGLNGTQALARLSHTAEPGPDGDDGQPVDPASSQPATPAPVSAYAARLPQFPAAPVPEPVTVPAGPAAGWYTHIPTSQPVAFLTIDDGWIKLPAARELLAAANVPVTLFLTIDAIRDDPEYFRQVQSANVVIEAHTISHPNLRGKSYATQRHEICGSADQLGQWYGRRPTLFRPPFGNKDATTLRAARDCGMKAAFFWTETVDKGKVRYQREHAVRAGDIILMHFRPAFVEDFIAALTAIHRAGLTPALLGDYVR
jgi:peptidoglycan/xylan/chitin deacetylase (PgdA/CDA1 family)